MLIRENHRSLAVSHGEIARRRAPEEHAGSGRRTKPGKREKGRGRAREEPRGEKGKDRANLALEERRAGGRVELDKAV